jgi:hypothetical protein
MGHIDESRVFQLGNIFAGQENNPTGNIYITEIRGWDESRAEFITVPRLFGAGSFITEKNLPEREITVTVVFADDDTFVGNIVNDIESQTHAMTQITATRTYGSRRTESLAVYVVGLTELTKWSDTEAMLQITLLATNPIKTIS